MTPGDTIPKDPDSVEPQGFNWTAFLADLGASAQITTSVYEVSGPDAALTLSNPSILSGNLRTQVFLSGGTPGKRYKVTNRITTNSTPAVVDDRSFYVRVRER